MDKEAEDMTELKTERLYLRQWKDSDYEPFYQMSMDPVVMEFLPPFVDREAFDAFFDQMKEMIEKQGWGFWAVERIEDGAFVGTVGMHKPGKEFGLDRERVEMGWRIRPEFQGMGYATEAAREVMRFGFEELGLDEIISFTALGNTKSLAVMEHLGMEPTGEVFDALLYPADSPHRPHSISRISKESWKLEVESWKL